MSFIHLLLLQLSAHLIADYTLQTDKKAKNKNKKGFKSPFLKWHILIVFLSSWILSFDLKFVIASLVIALTHWLIDGFKPKLNKNKRVGKYSFFIDQLLHSSLLIVVSFFFYDKIGHEPIINLNINYLLLFFLLLTTSKPSNIFIKELFIVIEIKIDSKKDDELLKAGRIIGTLERWLIVLFVITNHFEAVGFLIAAKSILRYSPKNNDGFNKTEYVLIGTMLSFGIAITLSVLYLNFK